MHVSLDELAAGYGRLHRGHLSRHAPEDRLHPSLFQYDYLVLRSLSSDVRRLIARVPGRRSLDLGSDRSPYQSELSRGGFEVRTLDLTSASGADYVGTAEATGLPDASFDLVLCTQVLEHCERPWLAMSEIARILRSGGHCIFSVPHVWFFHPHPADFWRFTQQGVLRLCEEGGLEPVALEAQGGTLQALAQVMAFAAYGVLGKLGAPIYLAINLVGMALDRLMPNDLFSLNFACLARKP